MRKNFRYYPILILGILLSSCSVFTASDPEVNSPFIEPTFEFGQEVRVSGRVVLSEPVNMSFTTSGRLVDMLVERGEEVNEGDILARLAGDQLEDAVFMAEASRDIAQLDYNRVMAGADPLDLLNAENDLTVAQAAIVLNSAQFANKEADISSAEARLEYLKSLPTPEDVAMAEAELKLAQANLELARDRMLDTVLLAPTDGIVILINFNPYDYVNSGRTVITLGDPMDLSVEVSLNEIEVTGISVGDEASISFAAIPDSIVKGEVKIIEPFADSNSGNNFRIVLSLQEVPEGVRWGMTAEVGFGN